MALSFAQTLIEVWRQALVDNAKTVKLAADSLPVRRTAKRDLRQVDFVFDGNEVRGLEQKSADEIPMGSVGTIWQEGDPIPQRGALCGGCGRWEGDVLWQACWIELGLESALRHIGTKTMPNLLIQTPRGQMPCYLAEPSKPEPVPGVVVLHDVVGMSQDVVQAAELYGHRL